MPSIDHHAAPRILDQQQVARYLARLSVRDELRQLFASLAAQRAVQPPQMLTPFPGHAGDVITYQGVLADGGVFGAKLSPYIVTTGKPVITAWTSLFSMQTGQPLLFCDAGQLTVERTAGTTALAIEQLARADSRHLALIGCGALGLAHLRHVLPVRDWKRVRVYAPGLGGQPERQQALQALDSRIQLAANVADCVQDADVIMLCTSSATPVLDMTILGRPALLTSISTNAVNAHEIDPASLPALDVYCDDRHSTPGHAGEMVLAARDGVWSRDAVIGDLADLAAQRCPLPTYQRHVFFRSIGMGLEDIAIARALLREVQANRD